MLDLRRLRLLRELRERGTIAAVADAMSYTPSAVSQQLRALEREAGVALTERVGRGVRLTDAGRGLADHTDGVLARLERAEAELAATSGAVRGRVRVSAFQTAARALVAPVMRPLAERHPGLRIELLEAEAEDALAPLRAGELDMAVAEEYSHAPRPHDPALERADLATDQIVLILPRDHPVAASDGPVRLSRLADETWCAPRADTLFADLLAATCRTSGGFEPDIRHRANDVALLIELAADGHGVTLVPAMGRPNEDPRVVIRSIAGVTLDRQIFASVRRGSGERPAIAATIAALRARAAKLGLPR